ncbi:unnamed protein product [Durusdinium trenchii]|uniref:Rhodanese domain-containing protein n=1 Tax=Durusdinium trenchii TaxID=1381693 RepID=A0ABP0P1B4_9DINO
MAKIEQFSNQDLSNTSWAFAKLAISNAMMMTVIAKKLVSMVKDLIPQDLANTAWAYATLGLPDSHLMDQILAEVVSKVNDFTTQNLSNTAWAYAKLGLWNDRLMQTLAHAIVRKIGDFDGQGLANVAWSFAVLGFKCPKLSEAILSAARVKIESLSPQELANLAWSWDVTGETERLRVFLQLAIPRFIAIEGFSDVAATTDLVNIAKRHEYQCEGRRPLETEFRRRLFQPLLKALQKCASAGLHIVDAVDELETEVQRVGLTNFGYVYARDAIGDLGFRSRPSDGATAPDWVLEARALARKYLEEWRMPGTENIVAVVSYELCYRGEILRQEPKVVTNGWAEGVHDDVKAMLRPVDARGWSCESYSERVALLELLEAARCQFGDDSISEMSGWLRMYHSHHTSVTGFSIFCQFRRQVPQVDFELDYDGGWYTWAGKPRPLMTLSGVTKQEAFCWILFGSSNATTVIRFAHGEPLLQLLLALFTYWSLYSASADYSTRFNTDGLDHGLFYMLLAICIFVMDVNWTGNILASGNAAARSLHLSFLAGCYLLLGLMHLRVALGLRRCRKFAVYHMLLNVVSVIFYLVAARSSETSCKVLCWFACAPLFLLRTCGIPFIQHIDQITKQRNAQDYINRAQSVMITTLALVVKCVVKGVKPGEIGIGNWDLLLLSLVLVLLTKLLMFDARFADTKWHAVRCLKSSWRPTVFLSLVPVAMAGVMMMAAGCFLILDLEFQDYDRGEAQKFDRDAGHHLNWGFGLMLLSVTVMRLLHNRPELPGRIARMWQVQVIFQLTLAFISFSFHVTTGREGLYRAVQWTAFLVLLNLLDLDQIDEALHLGQYISSWKTVRSVGHLTPDEESTCVPSSSSESSRSESSMSQSTGSPSPERGPSSQLDLETLAML